MNFFAIVMLFVHFGTVTFKYGVVEAPPSVPVLIPGPPILSVFPTPVPALIPTKRYPFPPPNMPGPEAKGRGLIDDDQENQDSDEDEYAEMERYLTSKNPI